jgi:signal transduction histidine kinase
LAFSRPSRAKNLSQDLSLLIDEIIEILKAMIPHNINVQWKSQKNSFLMVIDPLKFQQVMINLIFNSIEAMPDGGDLKISIYKENNRNICIEIEDTGYGIEDAFIKRMFMPYFTTKAKEKGSGLGLFVVKQIVKEYKGKIKVESYLKKGTIFKIFLPYKGLEKK